MKIQKKQIIKFLKISSSVLAILFLILINYFYITYSKEKILLPVEKFEFARNFPEKLPKPLTKEEKEELSKIKYEIITLDKVPKYCINAIVAVEDKNFFSNGGVDRNGLIRLFFNTIPGVKRSGGSTISQQIIKMSTNRFYSRNPLDKLKEIIWAIRLNDSFSKEELLEKYLNNIYMGEYNYGIAQASKTYFNKNIEDLNLAECSYLMGIPQLPNAYIPKDGKFPSAGIERHKEVLEAMEREGFIEISK
jgi:membrane peptidoglycan carboxypeptidase